MLGAERRVSGVDVGLAGCWLFALFLLFCFCLVCGFSRQATILSAMSKDLGSILCFECVVLLLRFVVCIVLLSYSFLVFSLLFYAVFVIC